jgi:hypothetical protein
MNLRVILKSTLDKKHFFLHTINVKLLLIYESTNLDENEKENLEKMTANLYGSQKKKKTTKPPTNKGPKICGFLFLTFWHVSQLCQKLLGVLNKYRLRIFEIESHLCDVRYYS